MESRKAGDSLPHLALRLGGIVFILIFVHSLALAGEAPGKKETKKKGEGPAFEVNKKDPIFITSDRMEADRKKNTLTYKGRVVAIQAEMTMRSDTLTAHYSPDMKGIKEVIAEGQVHLTQGDRVATGTKAVFDGGNQTIILTGNPVVRQGNSQISGSRIIFYIERDLAVAEGGSQERVTATIFLEDLGRRDKGETSPGKER